MLITISQLLLAIAAATETAGVTSPTVSRWASLAAALLEQGEATETELVVLTTHIRTMVEQDRDPMEEEWTALAMRSRIAHETIQSWRATGR